MLKPLSALPLILLTQTAFAEVPRVVTDIAPVQSLVAQVMGDLGEPEVIVDPGASPHSYALRPSQARALEQADLVFWVGHSMTTWLEGPLEQLAGNANIVALIDLDGTIRRDVRDTAVFAAVEAHDGMEEDGQEDHDEHGHDHHGIDPHAWLDPENGKTWLAAMAEALAAADPEHAGIYRQNAKSAQDDLDLRIGRIEANLAPVSGLPFVVFHDAYQYFETRFGLSASGAISLSDATAPSPARITAIRQEISDHGVVCVFSEPQFNPGLVKTVFEGSAARTAVIDPLGTALPPGPAHYGALLDSLADEMAGCLNE